MSNYEFDSIVKCFGCDTEGNINQGGITYSQADGLKMWFCNYICFKEWPESSLWINEVEQNNRYD